MRFKSKRNRDNGQSSTQTLESDRESLPFPEGGVFSAKTNATRPNMSQSRPSVGDDLDRLFDDIKSGLDELGDLLDHPFRLNAPDDDDNNDPRRAA